MTGNDIDRSADHAILVGGQLGAAFDQGEVDPSGGWFDFWFGRDGFFISGGGIRGAGRVQFCIFEWGQATGAVEFRAIPEDDGFPLIGWAVLSVFWGIGRGASGTFDPAGPRVFGGGGLSGDERVSDGDAVVEAVEFGDGSAFGVIDPSDAIDQGTGRAADDLVGGGGACGFIEWPPSDDGLIGPAQGGQQAVGRGVATGEEAGAAGPA